MGENRFTHRNKRGVKMRLITRQMLQAVNEKRRFKKSNTEVVIDDSQVVHVYLHGNEIYTEQPDGTRTYTNCDWYTQTTKERLQALLPDDTSLSQRQGVWFLEKNGEILIWHNDITNTEIFEEMGA